MYAKILGFDESGRMGDDQIYFCQVEFNEESEPDLFINNIVEVKDLLFKKNLLRGWDPKKKLKICHDLLKKRLVKIKFYKLNPLEQNKILRDVFIHQASFLYGERDKLIEIYNKSRKIKELTHLIAQLHHYRDYYYLPEFSMKSYSYLYILNRICSSKRIHNFLQNEDYIIKAQIDGGNVFSFWWFEFINNHAHKEILENNLFINGISHGDQYYLSMNIADLFSQSFRKDPQFFSSYPIEDITYNFDNINISENLFYESIWEFLKNFHFRDRLLFIGKSELFTLIPYLLNFRKRTVIYEPFLINKDVKDFFKYFKIGSKKKNLVVHSQNLSIADKQNVDYCKKLGLEIKRVDEFKDIYSDFNDLILGQSDYYDSATKRKIIDVLEKYRNYF